MEPVDPRIPLDRLPPQSRAVVIAKDQPEFTPLPVVITRNHRFITRWSFTDEERAAIASGEDLFLTVITDQFSPVRLNVGLGDWRND
jgi:hypothetical protein